MKDEGFNNNAILKEGSYEYKPNIFQVYGVVEKYKKTNQKILTHIFGTLYTSTDTNKNNRKAIPLKKEKGQNKEDTSLKKN